MWSKREQRRRDAREEPQQVATPLSSIRVLGSPEEVAQAVARALAFERNDTERSNVRLGRYEALRAAHLSVVDADTHAPAESA